MASSLEFGIDQFAVDCHLKTSAVRGDQFPRRDFWFELLQEIGRDTHGSWCIVSSDAVFDRDFRHNGIFLSMECSHVSEWIRPGCSCSFPLRIPGVAPVYPDIAQKVAEAVATGHFDLGILICNTGVGMSIAANKVKGIRAALCYDTFSARRARQHNDANILCLASRKKTDTVSEIVDAFLASQFEGGRHLLRLNKIKAMES